MSVSIKVAVRCRPFTIDDDLGVSLVQNNEEEGEVSTLRPKYKNSLKFCAPFCCLFDRLG